MTLQQHPLRSSSSSYFPIFPPSTALASHVLLVKDLRPVRSTCSLSET